MFSFFFFLFCWNQSVVQLQQHFLNIKHSHELWQVKVTSTLMAPSICFLDCCHLSEVTTGPPAHPSRCCSHLLQTPVAQLYSISGLLTQSPLCCFRSNNQSVKGIVEMVAVQVLASYKVEPGLMHRFHNISFVDSEISPSGSLPSI